MYTRIVERMKTANPSQTLDQIERVAQGGYLDWTTSLPTTSRIVTYESQVWSERLRFSTRPARFFQLRRRKSRGL